MSIEPPSSHPREINVAEPITPAYERVKLMLFKPFDLAKWITIGFCAWLAGLGEYGGGGFNSGYNGGRGNHFGNGGNPAEQFRAFYQQAKDFVLDNFYWILPLAIVLLVAALALVVVILWLNSRGKFMFLHCVALNKAEVTEPWTKFSRAGNSLFRFRLVLWLARTILILPLVVMMVVAVVAMVMQGSPDVGSVMTAVILGLAVIFFAVIFAIIHKFLVDFIVPLMYLRGGTCLAAWREFGGLLARHPGQFILYILFQIVLTMAIGVGVVFIVLLTCCVAGCLLALPFIGTVLFLPVLVLKRAYPLYFLVQLGPEYDVFPAAAKPVAVVPPPV